MQMRCSKGHLVSFANNPKLLCTNCLAQEEKVAALKAHQQLGKSRRKEIRDDRRERNSGTRWIVKDIFSEFVALYLHEPVEKVQRAAKVYAPHLARSRMMGNGRREKIVRTIEDQSVIAETDLVKAWEAAQLAKDESKKPWGYLRVSKDAEAAWDAFDARLKEAHLDPTKPQPNCDKQPEKFSDYSEDDMPSAEEAYEMCADCPLMVECGLYAELDRPAWGIFAGDRWLYGEVVND